jgi:hypothetical protein
MTLAAAVDLQNRFMAGFDLALGSAALTAAEATLRLGHHQPSEDALHLFRRCGPIWLTFAAAHAVAAARVTGRTGGRSPGSVGRTLQQMPSGRGRPPFVGGGVRAVMRSVGLANLAMTVAFGARGRGGRR